MRVLRILQLCPFFYPVVGGLENVVFELSAELVSRGHRVTVFTSDLSRDGRVPTRFEVIRGVEVYRFPVVLKLGSFASLWPAFAQALRRMSFDVIHAHSYRHPHCDLASLSPIRRTAKLILDPHWPEYPRGPVGIALARSYDGTFGRRLFRAADLVLVATPLEVPWVRGKGARRVEVLPHGIRDEYFASSDGQGFRERHEIQGFFILSVGRVDESKGFQYVVEALRWTEGLMYGIIGPLGPYHGHLRRLLARYNLEDRVRFFGVLSEIEKIQALDSCDAFLQPSLFEAFGISTLEAMARGKACIGSNVGGLAWLLEGSGLLTQAGDVKGIARALERLRADPAHRLDLGLKARRKASEMSWQSISPRYEQLVFDLLNA